MQPRDIAVYVNLAFFVFGLLPNNIVATRCIRGPEDISSPKTLGNNGFKISLHTHPYNETIATPEGYLPGELYTVLITGYKTKNTRQTFRGFSLLAVSEKNESNPTGEFKILEHQRSTIRMSSRCLSAVTEDNLLPKTSVEVVWQAPPTARTCVVFKATILEYRDTWYMDDGPLTQRLCPLNGLADEEAFDENEECCACDEANYELVMTGLWSKETHPKDYPRIEQLTHLSDIVGASHSKEYTMWKYGDIATDGMKELAEWGNTIQYEKEMKSEGSKIRTIVKARGLWYPNVLGTTRAVFRTDRYHHLFSVASMMGPSPDWVVGLSRLNLCTRDCNWKEERSFDLYPFDAGTDNGRSYMSPNNPANPREKIQRITTLYPSDSPFYNPEVSKMNPIARLTIRLQKVHEMECKNMSEYMNMGPGGAGAQTSDDLAYKDIPACRASEWSSWTACSATCGQGIRMRKRIYLRAVKAQTEGCQRQMIEKQFCSADINECADSEYFNDMCSTKQWSGWSRCSVTCGSGTRVRTREYESQMAIKICRLPLKDHEHCTGYAGDNCDVTPDPRCLTTPWSSWSPCSVTCGQGIRVRDRLYVQRQNIELCGAETLMEKETCTAEYPDCAAIIWEHKEEICNERMTPGSCGGVFPRYYYDAGGQSCRRFIYTGCGGNRNNFETDDECTRACVTGGNQLEPPEIDQPDVVPIEAINPHFNLEVRGEDTDPVDCAMTDWSEWSECSQTCGYAAKRTRTRMILIEPKNGGQPCPSSHRESIACRLRPCRSSCRLSSWTQWSQCSASCGKGTQTRRRSTIGRGVGCSRARGQHRSCFTGVVCP